LLKLVCKRVVGCPCGTGRHVIAPPPEVAEAVVIGLPDSEYGELPTGCVVRQPLSTISEKELQHFVDGNWLYN